VAEEASDIRSFGRRSSVTRAMSRPALMTA
jgi:hypothetical protein